MGCVYHASMVAKGLVMLRTYQVVFDVQPATNQGMADVFDALSDALAV
jgi:hypothetical protein